MIRLAIGGVCEPAGDSLVSLNQLMGARIVALVDSSSSGSKHVNQDQLSRAIGAGISVESWQDLFENHAAEFDAVACFSPTLGSTVATSALSHQKSFLVRGPIDPEPIDREMQQQDETSAASHAGMVVWPLREHPYQQAVYSELKSGDLGQPGLLRIHHWKPGVWHQNNDNFVSQGVMDELDVACWLMDAWPETIFATTIPGNERPLVRGVQVHLGFPEGAMAVIDCVSQNDEPQPAYYCLNLIGSRGAAYADDHRNTNLLLHRGETCGLVLHQDPGMILDQLQRFVTTIQGETNAEDPNNDSRRAVTVAQAAQASAVAGSVFRLKGDIYEPC